MHDMPLRFINPLELFTWSSIRIRFDVFTIFFTDSVAQSSAVLA